MCDRMAAAGCAPLLGARRRLSRPAQGRVRKRADCPTADGERARATNRRDAQLLTCLYMLTVAVEPHALDVAAAWASDMLPGDRGAAASRGAAPHRGACDAPHVGAVDQGWRSRTHRFLKAIIIASY